MVTSKVRVLIFVLISLFIVDLCESLEKGEKGVCVKKTTYICSDTEICVDDDTHERVPAKRGPRGRRTGTRVKTSIECCKDWIYDNDVCKPTCPDGCTDGICINVGVCQCTPPLTYEKGACVQPLPTCDPPCFNSKCVASNKCECNDNFVPYNDTLCAPECPKGYFNDPFECKPKCESGCVNSRCVKPDKCECDHGFVPYNETLCIPQCPEGYQNDPFECKPKCEKGCVNSQCVTPNRCECEDGFVPYNETLCVPKCPMRYFNDPIECKPKCDKPCKNGACTAPNTCTCNVNYEKKDRFNCVPRCTPPCGNGECIQPGVCSCFEDYELQNGTCIPKCENCENGHCVAPNECQCNGGYTKINGICEPVCDQLCVNGICIAPNECECKTGFELDAQNKFNCLPICEPKCTNGYCAATNSCSCYVGYESTANGCQPKCNSCENGDCIEPEKCKCHEGYEDTGEGCKPYCSTSCINGHCTAPGVCTCDLGYQMETDPETNITKCTAIEAVDCNKCEFRCEVEGMQYCCVNYKPVTFCYNNTEGDNPVPLKSTSLAGLGLSWIMGGVVALLLIVVVVFVIQRMWHNRKQYEDSRHENGIANGSVVYAVPHTLLHRRISEVTGDEEQEDTPHDQNSLLRDDAIEDNDRTITKVQNRYE